MDRSEAAILDEIQAVQCARDEAYHAIAAEQAKLSALEAKLWRLQQEIAEQRAVVLNVHYSSVAVDPDSVVESLRRGSYHYWSP